MLSFRKSQDSSVSSVDLVVFRAAALCACAKRAIKKRQSISAAAGLTRTHTLSHFVCVSVSESVCACVHVCVRELVKVFALIQFRILLNFTSTHLVSQYDCVPVTVSYICVGACVCVCVCVAGRGSVPYVLLFQCVCVYIYVCACVKTVGLCRLQHIFPLHYVCTNSTQYQSDVKVGVSVCV